MDHIREEGNELLYKQELTGEESFLPKSGISEQLAFTVLTFNSVLGSRDAWL